MAPAYVYPLAGPGASIGALLPAREWQEVYELWVSLDSLSKQVEPAHNSLIF